MKSCFVHLIYFNGDVCPICDMVNDRQELIDRALKAEQRAATMYDIFENDIVLLANLAMMVDPVQTNECMERVYQVFLESKCKFLAF